MGDAVVNGVVYEWYQTWEPGQQFAALAVGSVVAVLLAGGALGYRLHVEAVADRIEHAQSATTDPHARWVDQLTSGGDLDAWKHRDEQPRRLSLPPAEETVGRIFGDVFATELPPRAETATPAVGRVAVDLDFTDEVAAVNAVCGISPMQAAANLVDTKLMSPVPKGAARAV
jgi:hypothetical protein